MSYLYPGQCISFHYIQVALGNRQVKQDILDVFGEPVHFGFDKDGIRGRDEPVAVGYGVGEASV